MSVSPQALGRSNSLIQLTSVDDNSDENTVASVSFKPPRKQKKLKQTQQLKALVAIGVGAVISGDFFGWNYGLERGGFGGLVIATLVVCIMYICVALSLAELSTMYPTAEGAFAFSRAAYGPYAGFLCGFSESLEYVLLVPVILTGLGDHFNVLFELDNPNLKYIWWAIISILYLILHLWGPNPTFMSNVAFTSLSLITLLAFWCGCMGIFADDSIEEINDRIYNIPANSDFTDASTFFPKGFYGLFTSLTFAAWFFIAVEELPLTAEDAINPTKNVPKALIFSIIILSITAFMTLCFCCMLPGGSFNIANTAAPLVRSITAGLMDTCVNYNSVGEDICNHSNNNCIWNSEEQTCYDKKLSNRALVWDTFINIGTLIGLLTSCHCIILAGGRQLMSLTRNGCLHPLTYFDRISNSTPRIALSVDIILGFVITCITFQIGKGVDFLLSLSVSAACVSYIFSMLSFIKLRFKYKDVERPFRSPFGIIGAGFAAFVSFCVLLSFFVDVAVSFGVNMLGGVLSAFFVVYGLVSLEFLGNCCGRKSGKMRFQEYESKFTQIYVKDKQDQSEFTIGGSLLQANTIRNVMGRHNAL